MSLANAHAFFFPSLLLVKAGLFFKHTSQHIDSDLQILLTFREVHAAVKRCSYRSTEFLLTKDDAKLYGVVSHSRKYHTCINT